MELMSPLLLFALATLLPQALGKSTQKLKPDNMFDKVKLKNDRSYEAANIFTTFNETSKIYKVSNLQSVFMDPTCRECRSCMEKSIKAHKIHAHVNIASKTNDVLNQIDPEENTTNRNKRNYDIDMDLKIANKGPKKSKSNKNKKNKTFSVTKYSDEDKIYALKVKEVTTPLMSSEQNQTKAPVTKCQVYRVKESFSCESLGAHLILNESKRKIKNTGIREREKRDEKVIYKQQEKKRIVPLLIKHHVEDSQMSENFMPSIEETY